MKVTLVGPISTNAVRVATGLALEGAAEGYANTPIVPLAAELLRLGHEVHIVTLDPSIEETQEVSERGLQISFCPLRSLPAYRTRTRALDLFSLEIRSMVRVIRETPADIVHAHWTYEYAEAAVRSGRPHLVTMHDLGWQVLWHLRDGYRVVRLLMKYRVMPRINRLTVVSPFMKAQARLYGYLGPVHLIPNGLSLPEWDLAKPANRIAGPLKIVTVGDAGRLKNVQASVAAFPSVRERFPDAELHLFGPGLDAAYTAGENGVNGHGNVPYPKLMAFLDDHASLLVHTSLTESFGMIIAESKARGIPVIAGANSGGVPFVCGSNAGCTLVELRSKHELIGAILKTLSDREGYCTMARLARADTEDRFDIKLVAQAYIEQYKAALVTQR